MIHDLERVLRECRRFTKILITGPQRSGTTIAARILAEEFGLEYLDEAEIGTVEFELLVKQIEENDNFALQCPAMSSMIHRIPDAHEVLVVFMWRFPSEIIASQKRVNWDDEANEMQRYLIISELEPYIDRMAIPPICELIYHCWKSCQRSLLPHAIDLQYDSMSKHPLWVDKPDRKHFTDRQWKKEFISMPAIGEIGGMVGD